MPGIDYAKFDKIVDSDEEEDYDGYLRKTYGVTSDWKPGCGMQPPVLGGRTPGKEYEDHELPTMQEVEADALDDVEDDEYDGKDAKPSSKSEERLPRTCSSMCFGVLRLFQLFIWLMPLSIAATMSMPINFVMLDMSGRKHWQLESFVYPFVMLLTSVVGLLDAVIVGCFTTYAEGTRAVAFACWFKRLFIAYTFLAYEAMHTSTENRLAFALTLLMIFVWTLRKVWGYSIDLALVKLQLFGPSTSKTAWSGMSGRAVPGGRFILILEAVSELCAICANMINLPDGVSFLGCSNTAVMWSLFLFVECVGTCISFRNVAGLGETKAMHMD